MKYFYLSPDRTPQGPYNAAELTALRASGVIDDDTLAAVAGDAAWRPLRELNLGEGADAVVPPPVGPRALGNCPFCGQEIVSTETPAECPHCGATLHPGTGNLWLNFISCLRRYACFRGRAGRTEFWSFYLFYFLFSTAAEYVWKTGVMVFYEIPDELREQLHAAAQSPAEMMQILAPHLEGCFVALAGEYIVPLVLLLPFCGVCVRRLHDRGHSACSLVLLFLSMVCMTGALVGMASLVFPLCEQFTNREDLIDFLQAGPIQTLAYHAAVLVLGFILYCISLLYLFICCVLPTKEGANKYGPSL